MPNDQSAITDNKGIILNARDKVTRIVNYERTAIPMHIVETHSKEERQGRDEADHGSYSTKLIADRLEPEI